MQDLYEITIDKGQDIRRTITDYVVSKGWKNVMIPMGIGSVIDMEFTTPVENELPLRTCVTRCRDAAELLSFIGEIMEWDRVDPALKAVYPDKSSPLFVHIHASCATAGGHVMGGGLKDGRAFRAVRVFLVPLPEEGALS